MVLALNSALSRAMHNGAQSSLPVVKYVGHKVSKVRWKPQPTGAIESSDTFVSGSCEDEVSEPPLDAH